MRTSPMPTELFCGTTHSHSVRCDFMPALTLPVIFPPLQHTTYEPYNWQEYDLLPTPHLCEADGVPVLLIDQYIQNAPVPGA
jgi:hypothetical protein